MNRYIECVLSVIMIECSHEIPVITEIDHLQSYHFISANKLLMNKMIIITCEREREEREIASTSNLYR